MAKKYFAAQNLEAVMSVELQLKFCLAASPLKTGHQDLSVDDIQAMSIAFGVVAAEMSLDRRIALQRIILLFQPGKCYSF